MRSSGNVQNVKYISLLEGWGKMIAPCMSSTAFHAQ